MYALVVLPTATILLVSAILPTSVALVYLWVADLGWRPYVLRMFQHNVVQARGSRTGQENVDSCPPLAQYDITTVHHSVSFNTEYLQHFSTKYMPHSYHSLRQSQRYHSSPTASSQTQCRRNTNLERSSTACELLRWAGSQIQWVIPCKVPAATALCLKSRRSPSSILHCRLAIDYRSIDGRGAVGFG